MVNSLRLTVRHAAYKTIIGYTQYSDSNSLIQECEHQMWINHLAHCCKTDNVHEEDGNLLQGIRRKAIF